MTVRRILVTGSRDFTHLALVAQYLARAYVNLASPRDIVVVHGDARGADRLADRVARGFGWDTEPHPADWKMGKRAGHWRNQYMVDLGADLCLAFFSTPDSRGTTDCVARATEADIPVWRYPRAPGVEYW